MLAAIIALAALAAVFGIGLGFAAVRFKVEGDPLVEQIDKILPQTQCGQCGFPGCRPYASGGTSCQPSVSGDARFKARDAFPALPIR